MLGVWLSSIIGSYCKPFAAAILALIVGESAFRGTSLKVASIGVPGRM
jgi:hypothetical protein